MLLTILLICLCFLPDYKVVRIFSPFLECSILIGRPAHQQAFTLQGPAFERHATGKHADGCMFGQGPSSSTNLRFQNQAGPL